MHEPKAEISTPPATEPEAHEFEFRMRPQATPSGFRYFIDGRRANPPKGMMARWSQLGGPVTKADAEKLLAAFRGEP